MKSLTIPEPELPESNEDWVRPLSEEDRRTDIAWWYPILREAGLPQPLTEIFSFDENQLFPILDGQTPPCLEELGQKITEAAETLGGFPVFLRTGVFSGKHDWANTCFVPRAEVAGQHAGMIFYMGHLVDLLGLPAGTWAVREMLPNSALFAHPRYSGMPVGRERRYFVQDDQVVCHHPYWPLEAVGEEYAQEIQQLSQEPPEEVDLLSRLASRAGKALGGDWSVDFLWTGALWYLIDVAPANRSWHPKCPLSFKIWGK